MTDTENTPAAKPKPGQISVNITPATQAALDRMVEREGVTLTEAVRRLIALGEVLDLAVDAGDEVLVRHAGQLERQRLVA